MANILLIDNSSTQLIGILNTLFRLNNCQEGVRIPLDSFKLNEDIITAHTEKPQNIIPEKLDYVWIAYDFDNEQPNYQLIEKIAEEIQAKKTIKVFIYTHSETGRKSEFSKLKSYFNHGSDRRDVEIINTFSTFNLYQINSTLDIELHSELLGYVFADFINSLKNNIGLTDYNYFKPESYKFHKYFKLLNDKFNGDYKLGQASFYTLYNGDEKFLMDVPYKHYYATYDEIIEARGLFESIIGSIEAVSEGYQGYISFNYFIENNHFHYNYKLSNTIVENIDKEKVALFIRLLHTAVFYTPELYEKEEFIFLNSKFKEVGQLNHEFVNIIFYFKHIQVADKKGCLNYALWKKYDEGNMIHLLDSDVIDLTNDYLEIIKPKAEEALFPLFWDERRKAQLQTAVAKVFARNFAHNIGSHVAMYATNKAVKKRIKEENMYPTISIIEDKCQSWIDYTTEKFDNFQIARNEFMADYNLPPKNIYFYRQVILPFVENTLIMDSIAIGENIKYVRNENNKIRNRLNINVKYNNAKIKATYSELEPVGEDIVYPNNFPYFVEPKKHKKKSENALEKSGITLEDAFNIKIIENDFEVCLSSEHSIYSILENFIRNAAKHQIKKLNPEDTNKQTDLEIIVDVSDINDNPDFYDLLIYDNVSEISADTLRKLQEGIDDDLVGVDGELARRGLGVADMKINAHLLQSLGQMDEEKLKKALTIKYCEVDECSKPNFSQKANKEELEKLTDKEARYRFAYCLKLTKPKKIIWFKSGVNDNEVKNLRKQGIVIESDPNRLLSYANYNDDKPLAAYTFAILEKDLIQSLVEKSEESVNTLLFNLPFRVLINCKESNLNERLRSFYDNRRIQTVSDDFPLSHSLSCHDLLKNCWENWLKRWLTKDEIKRGIGYSRAHVYLYLDNETAAKRWGSVNFGSNSSIKLTLLDTIQTDNAKEDEYLIFYDRHGKGYSKVRNKGFSSEEKSKYFQRIAYFQFDGASSDFAQLFYPPADPEDKRLLLYQAAEAGLMNVLILDERIAELLTPANGDGNVNLIEEDSDYPSKSSKGDFADLFNLSKVFVVSSYGNDVQLSKIPNFELRVNNGTVEVIPPSYLKDVTLRYDAFIVHRTYLNKIFDEINASNDEVTLALNELIDKFTRVIVVSGGGYPHSLPKNVRVLFQPFEALRRNFKKYPSKLSLNQLL